jgi:hypothetical protein
VEVEAEVAQPKAGNRPGSFGVIQGGDDQDIHKEAWAPKAELDVSENDLSELFWLASRSECREGFS